MKSQFLPRPSYDQEFLPRPDWNRQIEGSDNGEVQQKDSTNVPAINVPASTRQQPWRNKHEQTSAQGNSQALGQVIADR